MGRFYAKHNLAHFASFAGCDCIYLELSAIHYVAMWKNPAIGNIIGIKLTLLIIAILAIYITLYITLGDRLVMHLILCFNMFDDNMFT